MFVALMMTTLLKAPSDVLLEKHDIYCFSSISKVYYSVKGGTRLGGLDCSFTSLHVLSYSLKIAHTFRKLLEHTNKAANQPIVSEVLHLTLFKIHVCLLVFHSFQLPYASVQF